MACIRDREEFVAIMCSEFPHRSYTDVLAMARAFMRYSATSQRLAEEICSVEVSAAEEERRNRRDEINDARITALATQWGMSARLSGDPRGCTVKLAVPSGRTNDWGREGICVP